MRFLRVAFVLAIALSLTASVYAETTSVKVSGDLTVRALFRSAYDYRDSVSMQETAGGVAPGRTGWANDAGGMQGAVGINGYAGANQNWWMSTAEVQVDAELTDNVSTVIRLLNERDWNVQEKQITPGLDLRPNGLGGYTPDNDEFNVQLDLAYVTLKNFVYCPLTVTIGRQDLWFGKGFVIGSNQVYNNWVNNAREWTAGLGAFSPTSLHAPEYTAQTAFDSVKAVLDYNPWTITGVYSNILNNTIAQSDGIDLWGVNVGYQFDCYKAEAEAYWFWKRDNSLDAYHLAGNNDVHTFGVRGSMDPIESLTLSGEVAAQAGQYVSNINMWTTRNRAAWALDVAAEYRGLQDCWMWKPKMAAEYIIYSGDNSNQDWTSNNNSNYYTGWDRMFRGKYDSAIREWVGTYYASYDYGAQQWWMPSCNDASFTNQSQLIFSGSLQPMDCLTLKGNWNLFWTMQDYVLAPNLPWQQAMARAGTSVAGEVKRGGFIGSEIDLQAIWDYTEDVSFGLLCAWFMPNGDVYYAGNNATASDIVGTVKVSF